MLGNGWLLPGILRSAILVFFVSFAHASYDWILPVENSVVARDKIVVLVKFRKVTASCKWSDLRAKVKSQSISYLLTPTGYPGEYYANIEFPLRYKQIELSIEDSSGNCNTRKRNLFKVDSLGPESFVESLGINNPANANKLRTDWADAMLILGLSQFVAVTENPKRIENFLHHYFSKIQKEGFEVINHPDQVPLIMGNQLFNLKYNTNYSASIDEFKKYFSKIRLNELGLIDHMGENWPKRIGSSVILGYLGVPHSIWADSMMMYVMPSIMVGFYNRDIRTNIDGLKGPQISLYEFGLNQLDKMIDLLFSESLLFKHTYDYRHKSFRPSSEQAFWMRSNSWALATLAMSLDYLDKNSELYLKVSKTLVTALKKTFELRNKEVGIWRTMLLADNNFSTLQCARSNDFEISGSVINALALAIALNHRLLDPSYRETLLDTFHGINQFFKKSKTKNNAFELTWMSAMTNSHRHICNYEDLYLSNTSNRSYGAGPYLYLIKELKTLGIL